MREARWSQRALRDLASITDHYADIAPDYAVRVGDAILDAVDFLLDALGAGALQNRGNTRKWTVARIPYVILYRATRQGIGIARIRHARENWRGA